LGSTDKTLFEDPSMEYPQVYTKEIIKPKNLKLLYKGTGL